MGRMREGWIEPEGIASPQDVGREEDQRDDQHGSDTADSEAGRVHNRIGQTEARVGEVDQQRPPAQT